MLAITWLFLVLALCSSPSSLENGTVTFTGNSVGDNATYTCDSGFELVGEGQSQCTQLDNNSASFIPAAPSCQRKLFYTQSKSST